MKLSNNELSDISILKFAKFQKLKSLILSNNNIKNIEILGEVDFPILQELKLSNNKITDIKKLKSAKFAKTIKKLYLSHNNISEVDSLMCSSCYSEWDDSRNSNSSSIGIGRGGFERGRGRGGRGGIGIRIGLRDSFSIHHECPFKELKELKIAVNSINRTTNKEKIEYLKSHVSTFII